MILNKTVSKQDFYKEYYTALNGVLKLSKLELDILAKLSYMKYSGEDFLSKGFRKEVANSLSITTFNLNNYIGILKDKNMLIITDKGFDINPSVYMDITDTKYKIEFNFYVK